MKKSWNNIKGLIYWACSLKESWKKRAIYEESWKNGLFMKNLGKMGYL